MRYAMNGIVSINFFQSWPICNREAYVIMKVHSLWLCNQYRINDFKHESQFESLMLENLHSLSHNK